MTISEIVKASALFYALGACLVWLALAASQAAGMSNFSQPQRATISMVWPASVGLFMLDAITESTRLEAPGGLV